MAIKPFDWTCPYCNRPQIVTDENYFVTWERIVNGQGALGSVGARIRSILCRNADCMNLSLEIDLTDSVYSHPQGSYIGTKILQNWSLLPESSAKPQPQYIPAQLREDYTQACRISNLSPK